MATAAKSGEMKNIMTEVPIKPTRLVCQEKYLNDGLKKSYGEKRLDYHKNFRLLSKWLNVPLSKDVQNSKKKFVNNIFVFQIKCFKKKPTICDIKNMKSALKYKVDFSYSK